MRTIKFYRASLLIFGLTLVEAATPPVWWSTRGVIVGQADDYAAANLGQLKTMSTAAAFEMNARLSGGAGTAINGMVNSWCQPASAGVSRDDYAVLTIGQLKYVAKGFYDRLSMSYPWTSGTGDDDDYAAVNLGQLKYVFSFSIAASGDTDADGLPDAWEIANFGNLTAQSSAADYDTDGLSNLAEYRAGTNPSLHATDVTTSGVLALVVYSP